MPVRGVSKLRRKLRRLEPAILREVSDPLRDGANRIARDARSFVPVDQGDLRDSIDAVVARDGLTAIIGPGAKAAENVRKRTGSAFGRNARSGKNKGKAIRLSKANKHLYFQFLKGLWVEFGTKGSSAVPAQPARPFMRPAFDVNKRSIIKRVQVGIDKALDRVARG